MTKAEAKTLLTDLRLLSLNIQDIEAEMRGIESNIDRLKRLGFEDGALLEILKLETIKDGLNIKVEDARKALEVFETFAKHLEGTQTGDYLNRYIFNLASDQELMTAYNYIYPTSIYQLKRRAVEKLQDLTEADRTQIYIYLDEAAAKLSEIFEADAVELPEGMTATAPAM